METLILELIAGFKQFGAVGLMLALLLLALWWILREFTRWAAPHADHLINKWQDHIDTIGNAISKLCTATERHEERLERIESSQEKILAILQDSHKTSQEKIIAILEDIRRQVNSRPSP